MNAATSSPTELEALAETLERAAATLREQAQSLRSGRKRGTSPLRTTGTTTETARERAEKALKRLDLR
jgi:hypothetical protein